MSGDWIKVQTNLPSKREVVAISAQLGLDRYAVVGRLIELWSWFDANTVDGFCNAVSVTYVDDLCRQNGFADALIAVGWLRVSEDPKGVLMPHFERHNGKSSKNRALNSERQSSYRANSNGATVTKVTQDALPEKRREEKEQKISTSTEVEGETPVSPCPVVDIVKLYHELLPMLPRVEKITKTRAGYIRQRWREDLKSIDQWRNFFEFVGKSRFLTGKVNGHADKPPFRADIEWLCRPSNFAKIAEEKYHRV